MSILDIVTYPDEFLRHPTKDIQNIDGELQQLIDDMAQTMYVAPGIGLAAIQVGIDKSLLIFDVAPPDEDRWDGDTGFIHQVLYANHLRGHPAPEAVEYYLCGPPVMIAACRKMLDDLGVEPDNILYDDFGS